jgi:hypothetical protein
VTTIDPALLLPARPGLLVPPDNDAKTRLLADGIARLADAHAEDA